MAQKIFKSPLTQAQKLNDDDIRYALFEYLDNDPTIDEEGTIEETLRRYTHKLNDGQGVPIEEAVRIWTDGSGLTGTNTWKDWLKYNNLFE